MKQVLQSLKDGSTNLLELPEPNIGPNEILISTIFSLISSGTERMLVQFGKSNLFDKALSQPEKIQQVFDKARTDGIFTTIGAVKSKLDELIPLGYCNVGYVVGIGSQVSDFRIGERVASSGPHAEVFSISQNLCASVPNEVSNEEALFTVLGAIGLQGIRLAKPSFGETFLVSGLGLIGFLTAQLLLAQGCNVIALDTDPSKVSLAKSLGINALALSSDVNAVDWCLQQTNLLGVDGALITAATKSSAPINLAAEMCRQRGRIVQIGLTGINLSRELFYKKELSFQVSCSSGPGKNDKNYENATNDYPIGLVRWSLKRNFNAVLDSFKKGNLNITGLISHRFSLENVQEAYQLLVNSSQIMGIIIEYKNNKSTSLKKVSLNTNKSLEYFDPKDPVLSFVGAGNYAGNVLIPAFKRAGARLYSINSNNGIKPLHLGSKFGFKIASTDTESLLNDDKCNTIVITTRHDSHAYFILKALKSGKNVFVEKPICLNKEELLEINSCYSDKQLLMVGYNRRFSPLIVDLKNQLDKIDDKKSFIYTCNAGEIACDHWTQDPMIGGGRLLGEACHFVDLIRFLVNRPIENLTVTYAKDSKPCPDTFTIQMRFIDGSIGNINYFANGSRLFPKERLEVFSSGKIFCLNNFQKLKAWGVPGFNTKRLLKQDKGQNRCAKSFIEAIKNGGPPPIPIEEIFEVHSFLLDVIN